MDKIKTVSDGRDFYWEFHKQSMNPSSCVNLSNDRKKGGLRERNSKKYNSGKVIPLCSLSKNHSPFLDLLGRRKSVRSYSTPKISFVNLCGLLKSAYGMIGKETINLDGEVREITHRTVPSGGALYPLEIYVIVLADISNGNVGQGLYYFDKEKEVLVKLRNGDFHDQLKKIFFRVEKTINKASLFIIVTAIFSKAYQKALNRGYRHLLLEAGHLAQNIYLYGAEQNLGIVELSCFRDRDLAKFLGLNIREEAPMTTIAIGSK